jgi:hypothetical protein
MRDSVRAHRRIGQRQLPGRRFAIEGLLPRPLEVFVPEGAEAPVDLLLHFHGAAPVVEYAGWAADPSCAVVTVNLGAGSAVYRQPLIEQGAVTRLCTALEEKVAFKTLWLSGFSAGYGAVGALLEQGLEPDGVLLLDGLHSGYLPEGGPENGPLEVFLSQARRALSGETTFLVTHSAVFPGTYASTTECADWLLQGAGLTRRTVLGWGPLGMQRLSQTFKRGFGVLGFAGNSAPDHMDHLHGLYRFFSRLRRLSATGMSV